VISSIWRDFEPGLVNELSTLFDPRYLDYRSADFDAVSALRQRLGDRIPSKLEIGSNSGEFLEGLNQRSTSDRPAIGIEHDGTQFNLSVKRRDKRKWQQAEVLRADARIAVPLLFAPGSLDEIHVHFPDPWWKDRHANRRLLEPLFLRILARRLRPGCG
jgi:tRNA (guanine-N7-)-methyltransferase